MKGLSVGRLGVEQMTDQSALGGRDGRGPRLVTPGASLGASEGRHIGHGIVVHNGEMIAVKLGALIESENEISILPTHTRYTPRPGDLVIGVVEAVQSNLWFLDINAPFNALLPMSLGPGKSEFGGARHVLNVGYTVLCRIQEVDETHSSVVTMKGLGLRRVDSGIIEEIPPHLMNTLFSNGDALKLLKSTTDCRIVLADNGRMWIDGSTSAISSVISKLQRVRSMSRDISNLDAMIEVLQEEVQ